jgi:hypothetical protein
VVLDVMPLTVFHHHQIPSRTGGMGGGQTVDSIQYSTEPVLLNVYGASELIPRNEFRQPM